MQGPMREVEDAMKETPMGTAAVPEPASCVGGQ